jgi:Neurotransmitter-gated ion-channel ligand binding domain
MKRPGRFGAVLGLFVVLTAIPSFGVQNKPAQPAVDLRQHPTAGKTPVEISAGLYITNIVAIDETRESFEVGGYLTGRWLDPRLVDAAASATRIFRVEDLWTPAIEAANSISHRTSQHLLTSDRNGVVTYVERFEGVFSSNFDLRKFPFDTQRLQFEFQPFLSAASEIRFASQPLPSTGISPEQHTDLAAWKFKDLQYSAEKVAHVPSFMPGNEALFKLVVQRRAGFYVWKAFVPLLMMTLIPGVVFWIDVSQFDWLLKIPMTMLLSMVALEFTLARDLPRIGYMTLLDAVFLVGFAFCFFTILEITLVFLLQLRGRREFAVKLHWAGRWFYPLSYVCLVGLLAVCFLA